MARNSEVDEAIQNLQAIKNGEDPTADSDHASEATSECDRLALAKQEVDRLYDEFDLSDHLPRSHLHVAVANWDKKNGVCKYRKKLGDKSRFNKRMTGLKSAGLHHVIAINESIDEDDEFIDTVRHEVAHAIAYEKYDGSQKHNQNWKHEASRLGADPKSCHRKGIDTDTNYYIECLACGLQSSRVRLSKVVKKPHLYRCGKCEEMQLVSYDADREPPSEAGKTNVEKLE